MNCCSLARFYHSSLRSTIWKGSVTSTLSFCFNRWKTLKSYPFRLISLYPLIVLHVIIYESLLFSRLIHLPILNQSNPTSRKANNYASVTSLSLSLLSTVPPALTITPPFLPSYRGSMSLKVSVIYHTFSLPIERCGGRSGRGGA